MTIDDQTKQVFEQLVTKIVNNQITNILRLQQGNIAIGTVLELDPNGKRARVQLFNSTSGDTGFIPYPNGLTTTSIGVGSRVLVISTDPNSTGNRFIVGSYGGF